MKLKGRIWVIKNRKGKMIHDIDTDQIYHNKHLAVVNIEQMGQYAFGNLEEWKDFAEKAKKGDIIFAGENFGAGSSRQHAVDCFISLGISGIVAESFGAIYKRNAINSALPILEFPGLTKLAENGDFETGDNVELHLEKGEILNFRTDKKYKTKPSSRVEIDIYKAGGLFAYGKRISQ